MLFLIWINSGIDICKMNFDGILKSRVGIKGEGNNKEIKAVIHETCVIQLHEKENDFKKGGKIKEVTATLYCQLWFNKFEDRVLGCNLLFLSLLIPWCAEFCHFCHSPLPNPSLLKYPFLLDFLHIILFTMVSKPQCSSAFWDISFTSLIRRKEEKGDKEK